MLDRNSAEGIRKRQEDLRNQKWPPTLITYEKQSKTMEVKETLRNKVYQALGGASMCWKPLPSDQVFDSTQAKKLGDELMAEIESDLPNAVQVLCKAMREDTSYYGAWKDNISIAFQEG